MKTVLKISALVAVLLVAFSMVGCKDPVSPSGGASIVGTWTGTGGWYDGATITFNNNSTYNLTIEGYTETGSYTVGEISVNGKYPVTIQPTGGDSFSVEQFGWDKDGDNKIYYAGGSFTKQ